MSQELIEFLMSELSIEQKARKRVRGTIVKAEDWLTPEGITRDYIFSLTVRRLHEINRTALGESIEICGYVDQGTLYSYPGANPLIGVVGIAEPGFYRIRGRVKIRKKKEIRVYPYMNQRKLAQSLEKYIEVRDFEVDDTEVCANRPPLTASELQDISSEWVNAPTDVVATILSTSISSPYLYQKLGGHSIILDSPPDLEQPIKNEELESFGKEFIRAFVPIYNRSGSFFISCQPMVSKPVERMLRSRTPTSLARREVSIIHPRGYQKKKINVPQAVIFDDVIPLDESDFTLDEKGRKEALRLADLIGISVMAYHAYFPLAEQRIAPECYDEHVEWINKLRNQGEVYRKLTTYGGLTNPSFSKSLGASLRLSGALARMKGLNYIDLSTFKEALKIRERHIHDFVALRRDEILKYEEEEVYPRVGRAGKMAIDAILEFFSRQVEGTKNEAVDYAKRNYGISTQTASFNFDLLVRRGKIYDRGNGIYRWVPE